MFSIFPSPLNLRLHASKVISFNPKTIESREEISPRILVFPVYLLSVKVIKCLNNI